MPAILRGTLLWNAWSTVYIYAIDYKSFFVALVDAEEQYVSRDHILDKVEVVCPTS
jgi:hypothetical protein